MSVFRAAGIIRQGKVRYIGCSNFKAWQVAEARWTSRALGLAPFVTCQDVYSVLIRRSDRDLTPMMQACGMGLLPYYPLASGALTGKYRRNTSLPVRRSPSGWPRTSVLWSEG